MKLWTFQLTSIATHYFFKCALLLCFFLSSPRDDEAATKPVRRSWNHVGTVSDRRTPKDNQRNSISMRANISVIMANFSAPKEYYWQKWRYQLSWDQCINFRFPAFANFIKSDLTTWLNLNLKSHAAELAERISTKIIFSPRAPCARDCAVSTLSGDLTRWEK